MPLIRMLASDLSGFVVYMITELIRCDTSQLDFVSETETESRRHTKMDTGMEQEFSYPPPLASWFLGAKNVNSVRAFRKRLRNR